MRAALAIPEVAMDYPAFLLSFADRINRARFWWTGLTIVCWM
jgi:uncharacterized membrane protein YhaH (DUF805 family)